jgi:HD superfamily phosphohydrolase
MPVNPLWPVDDILEVLRQRYESEEISTYWDAERVVLEGALRAIADHLASDRYIPKGILGVGGSGVVVRLQDKLFPKLDKALKFPRPVPDKVHLVSEMLKKEILYLAELRHSGIVRIVYYAALEGVPGYPNLPFYLMEYVDGVRSKDFARAPTTSEAQFRTMVSQAADTLSYLHKRRPQGFAHLDIKQENIMVTASGQTVAIDLGTCKRLGLDDGVTVVACTRSNAHPELVRRLTDDPSDDNRAKGDILRSEIDPAWDLWAFGLTLLDWLGVNRDDGRVAEDAIYHRLSSYTRKYYLLRASRLLSYSVRSWLSVRVGLSQVFLQDFPVTSADELCEVLDRLEGSRGPIGEIEELSSPSSGSIQAARGTHVSSTKALAAVLDHRLYRRLNSISQLGIVSQVYPGAKHTRREHSLGTFANTGRILRALYEDSYSPLFRQIVTSEDCRTVLLASLLHDIGHFPLAHDLEELGKKEFSHAELTHAMLRGEWDKKKKGSRPVKFADSFSRIFDLWQVKPERIASVLSAKPKAAGVSRRDKLLRSIFSGPIDADKLDYLVRDALHTDVPYPLGIDTDMLLRCMTTVVINQGAAHDVPMIGVHDKGKVAAEFLILARYAMFSQVYWHHAVRAQKAMLSRAVGALLAKFSAEDAFDEFKSDFVEMVTSLPEALYQRSELLFPELGTLGIDTSIFGSGTDLSPTDAAVLSWFRDRLRRIGRPEALLIEGILRRRLFKRLWVVGQEMDPKRWADIVGLWDQLDRVERNTVSLELEKDIVNRLTPAKIASVTEMKAEQARDKIAEKTAGEIPWLLIDIPGDRPGADIGLQYVLEGQRRQLRKNDRAVGELQPSAIWEKYAGGLRAVAGKLRVFCDPELVDTVESSIDMEEGLEALEDAIEGVRS